MVSSLDEAASNLLEIGSIMSTIVEKKKPNKTRRKNPNPCHLNTYLSAKTPVQTSETETKSKGKRVSLKTDCDVKQMKNNTSSGNKKLVLKEVVHENLPITPQFRSDQINDHQDTPENAKNTSSCGFGFEHCVKIIRQLECSGHVESHFRQKFLTWFSLKATSEEINVVKTFIHAFKDDTIALAEQLVDTFSDCISRKSFAVGNGDEGCSSGALSKKPRH